MKEEAIKQYQELLEKYPQSDQSPQAKERIEAVAEVALTFVDERGTGPFFGPEDGFRR